MWRDSSDDLGRSGQRSGQETLGTRGLWARGLWALALSAALALAAVTSPAAADYAMPTTATVFNDASLLVIDGDVLGFDPEGKARVAVRAALWGAITDTDGGATTSTTLEVMGVRYTCFGGSIRTYGVEAGKRYVLLLLGEEMMEEQSYFPVTERGGVAYVALKPNYGGWLGLGDGSAPLEVSLESLRTRLAEMQAAQATTP